MKKFVLICGLSFLSAQVFSQEPPVTNSSGKVKPVSIEAEKFFNQEKAEKRAWVRISSKGPSDSVANQASAKAYIQCLPDTRATDKDKLINGENFTNNPGEMAVISYKIRVRQPGMYYVWARCYSTGAEDNGIHVGLNGNWPESGKRMQWCDGKNKWTWASKQRTEAVHCGEPYLIYLDIEKPGKHVLQFSMREDGFRMDKILLTTDKLYIPE
jgi:hypothetical protein